MEKQRIAEIEQFVLQNRNLTPKAICKELGVSLTFMYHLMDRLGVERPRREEAFNICERCAKATDYRKCSWVDNFVYPMGVKLKGNTLIECPQFQEG